MLTVSPGRIAIPRALTPVTGRSLAVTRRQLSLAVQQIVGAFAVTSRRLARRLGDTALACVAVTPSSSGISLPGRMITAAGDSRPIALVSHSIALAGRGIALVSDDVTPLSNTVALISREVTILSRDHALLSITIALLSNAITLLSSAVTMSGRTMSTINHHRTPPDTQTHTQTDAQNHIGSRRE